LATLPGIIPSPLFYLACYFWVASPDSIILENHIILFVITTGFCFARVAVFLFFYFFYFFIFSILSFFYFFIFLDFIFSFYFRPSITLLNFNPNLPIEQNYSCLCNKDGVPLFHSTIYSNHCWFFKCKCSLSFWNVNFFLSFFSSKALNLISFFF